VGEGSLHTRGIHQVMASLPFHTCVTAFRFTICYIPIPLTFLKHRCNTVERYPGDEWVDILGLRKLLDFQSGSTISNGISQLRMLVEMATARKKLAALTECGFDGIPVKKLVDTIFAHTHPRRFHSP